MGNMNTKKPHAFLFGLGDSVNVYPKSTFGKYLPRQSSDERIGSYFAAAGGYIFVAFEKLANAEPRFEGCWNAYRLSRAGQKNFAAESHSNDRVHGIPGADSSSRALAGLRGRLPGRR